MRIPVGMNKKNPRFRLPSLALERESQCRRTELLSLTLCIPGKNGTHPSTTQIRKVCVTSVYAALDGLTRHLTHYGSV